MRIRRGNCKLQRWKWKETSLSVAAATTLERGAGWTFRDGFWSVRTNLHDLLNLNFLYSLWFTQILPYEGKCAKTWATKKLWIEREKKKGYERSALFGDLRQLKWIFVRIALKNTVKVGTSDILIPLFVRTALKDRPTNIMFPPLFCLFRVTFRGWDLSAWSCCPYNKMSQLVVTS